MPMAVNDRLSDIVGAASTRADTTNADRTTPSERRIRQMSATIDANAIVWTAHRPSAYQGTRSVSWYAVESTRPITPLVNTMYGLGEPV